MSGKKTKRLRMVKGTTSLIALLLVGSAVIRLSAGSGRAIAQGVIETAQPVAAEPSPLVTQQDTRAAPRAELGRMLAELKEREARVAEREQQIALRTKALRVADEEISKRLETLEQAEQNLRATLALADGAAENDLARLTAVYENMKPKDVAALFEAMEPAFAAGFLGRMRADAAAAVMAGLQPETAYTISVILAGRNANAPRN